MPEPTLDGELRRDRIDVDLEAYQPLGDDAPKEMRVDLVDADTLDTVASLTPYQALTLAGALISAVQQVRENGHGYER